MVCHKKCLNKITSDCSSFCAKKVCVWFHSVLITRILRASVCGPGWFSVGVCVCVLVTISYTPLLQNEDDSGMRNFGVRVCRLVSDKAPVPFVLEIMLEHVEMNGLYTEGIYRKSGSANRMKELHQKMEAGKSSNKLLALDILILYLKSLHSDLWW